MRSYLLQVGNERFQNGSTVNNGNRRVYVTTDISRFEGEGHITKIPGEIIVEHGAHALSLAHHLINFLSRILIEGTILQIVDEVVGCFYALVKLVPGIAGVTALARAVKTLEVVFTGSIT